MLFQIHSWDKPHTLSQKSVFVNEVYMRFESWDLSYRVIKVIGRTIRSPQRPVRVVRSFTATSTRSRVRRTTRWTGEPHHRKCPARPRVRLCRLWTCPWAPAGVAIIKLDWHPRQVPWRPTVVLPISPDCPVPATRTRVRRISTSSKSA